MMLVSFQEIMMRNVAIVVGSLLAALSVGCGDGGGGGGDYEIAAGDLSGKINGKAWTYASASTDSFLSDDTSYFTTFISDKVDGCTQTGGGMDMLAVISAIPKAVGEYDLGLKTNVTLADGSNNLVSTTGKITVDKSDGQTLQGGMYAIYNDDPNNEISGHFTATICASMTP